jgi:hypothetical protein
MRVRLPLQTGASALRDVVAAAAAAGVLFWLGVAIGALGIMSGVQEKSAASFLGGPWVGLIVMGFGLARLSGGLSSARTHRASDCEIDDEGFTIRGGRKDRQNARWADLLPDHCSIEDATAAALGWSFGGSRYTRAFFVRFGGEPNLVAETAEDDEERSASALVEAIAARAGAAEQPPDTELVATCRACGAPALPDDADEVACSFCSARVAIPAEVRARIRDSVRLAETRAALERTVGKLLDQPGATRINLGLAIAAFTLTAAAIGAPVLGYVAPRGGIVLVAAAIAAYAGVRAQIERRRALREIVLGFAARTDARGVGRCRRCLGALPAGSTVVSPCAWCGAANVRGLAFGRRAAAERKTERDLAAELARRRNRGVSMVIVAVMAAIVAIAVTVVS